MEIEKKSYSDSLYSQNVILKDRKSVEISGLSKIDSFDNEEFLLETVLGYLLVTGSNLEMINLDTDKGKVSIKGQINQFVYLDDDKNGKTEDSIFNRLFK